MRRLVLIAISGVALVGCVPQQTTRTIVLSPPNVPAAGALKRVAVLTFQGNDGERVTASFESKLAQASQDGQPYFTVIDRRTLQNAINEVQPKQADLMDPATAARVGRFIGVEGIYSGAVIAPQVARQSRSEERVRCPEGSKKLFCKDGIRSTVHCTEKTVTYTVIPRLVAVDTAQVVYQSTRTATRKENFCDGEGRETADDVLLDAARTEALEKVFQDVAPHAYLADLHLKSADDTLVGNAVIRFEDGMAFAKANRMDRACAIWGELEQANSQSLPLAYNLAVCEEVRGRFSDAFGRLKAVDARLTRPDTEVNEALARVNRRMVDQQRLDAMSAPPAAAPAQPIKPVSGKKGR